MTIDISKLTVEEIVELKKQLATVQIKQHDQEWGSDKFTKKDYSFAEGWDWLKSNWELAAEYGLCYATVAKMRKFLNKPKSTKLVRLAAGALADIDWNRADAVIAREHRLDVAVVRKIREKVGQPKFKRRDHVKLPSPMVFQRQKMQEKYAALNWERPDIEVAKELGLTREAVRLIRIRLGKPKHVSYHVRYQQFVAAVNGAKKISLNEVNKVFPIHADTFKKYCRRAGVEPVASERRRYAAKYPWEKFDWMLPSTLLAKIWQVSAYNMVASYRSNHYKPLALFRYNENGFIPVEFQARVKAQDDLAAQHFGGIAMGEQNGTT